jgi:hypothetical protein
MKRAAVLLCALAALLSGCSPGKVNGSIGGGAGASVLINAGDAVNDEVIVFQLPVTAATLAGGSNPSVLSTPAQVEFAENAAKFLPLSLTNVPSGTYTAVTLTVATPTVVIVDPNTQAVTPLTVALSSTTVNVPLSPAITIDGSPLVVNLELDLANSITISGNSATVAPVFTAVTSPIAPVGSQDDTNGEVDNIRGTVTGVAASSFTIQPPNTGQALTFLTDASTQFNTGGAQIIPGMILTVEAVSQTDGSLLARKVESETETATGQALAGVVTASTGAPATSINLAAQSIIASNAATAPAPGDSVSVLITSTTLFSVQSNTIPGPLPAFDAATIGLGQQVLVDSETQPVSSTSAQADKIKLQEQVLFGSVTGLSGNNFDLSLSTTSAFFSLTGVASVPVQTSASTQLQNVTLADGVVVRVRGLLFFDGTSYSMIASRITP